MTQTNKNKKPLLLRILFWFIGIIIFLVLAGYIAMQVSPWPKALLVRDAFRKGGENTNANNEKFVPPGIASQLNLNYGDSNNEDETLDIYYPENTDSALTTVVWIHGGGWLGGDKSELSNYCKVLASKGYTVVSMNYSLAPGTNYPEQIFQINKALSYLTRNASKYNIDPKKILLAGDSGGAHLASVVANVISSEEYALKIGVTPGMNRDDLAGVILYCGPYDLKDKGEGDFRDFSDLALWSFSGTKDFESHPPFSTAYIIDFIVPEFPPAFISVGNKDPFDPHGRSLARKLSGFGVYTDTLFFPADYEPGLPHEYQFNLGSKEGMLALDRSIEFINKISADSIHINPPSESPQGLRRK
jgi:acetyl esterase